MTRSIDTVPHPHDTDAWASRMTRNTLGLAAWTVAWVASVALAAFGPGNLLERPARADAGGDRLQRAGRRRHAVRQQTQPAGRWTSCSAPSSSKQWHGRWGPDWSAAWPGPCLLGTTWSASRPKFPTWWCSCGGLLGRVASPACCATDEEPAQGAARWAATGPRPIWRWRWRSRGRPSTQSKPASTTRACRWRSGWRGYSDNR